MWKHTSFLLVALWWGSSSCATFAQSLDLVNGSLTNRLSVSWSNGIYGAGAGQSLSVPCPNAGTRVTAYRDGVSVSEWDLGDGTGVAIALDETGAVYVLDRAGASTRYFWAGIFFSLMFGLTVLGWRWMKVAILGTVEGSD